MGPRHGRRAEVPPVPESLRPRVYPLWPEGSPQNGDRAQDRPRLELYLPSQPSEPRDALLPAVVICPGGGYSHRAPHEAAPVAWMFARQGIAAAVCHYRVAPHRYPAPYADVARAMRLMRHLAPQLGVNPGRIALMGFSAGGHAAVTVATRPRLHIAPDDDLAGTLSARPNRTILAYPVVSMVSQVHEGCRENLLGAAPDPHLSEELSAELWVDAYTPPTFLFHTADDPAVPAGHSLRYAAACDAHSVPVEMHLFAHGRHGVGLAQEIPALAPWPRLLLTWLADWPALEGLLP
jgi:acetyl esterase/lipase